MQMKMIRATAFVALLPLLALVACEDEEVPLAPDEPDDELGIVAEDFATFDTNDDQVLNQEEFVAGFQSESVFDDFDDDASGFLETDEFEEESLGDVAAFNDFDVNNDGLINQDEFLTTAFGVFDSNDDALVDEEEFQAGIALF